MGTIYQRKPGGTYYGYWTDPKNRHRRQSLRTRDPQVARVRLRQLELVSTDPAAHSRHTLNEAIANLLDVVERGNAEATHGAYKQKACHLQRILGNIELADITRDGVVLYMRQRKVIEHAADGTIHKELVVLRRALAEARERGLWKGEPRSTVPSIKVRYEPRTRWLDQSQAAKLLAELEPNRRLWVAIAAMSGPRSSEVERLRWEHVDFKAKRMRVPGQKTTGSWRIVPLHPSLVPLLKDASKGKKPQDLVVARWTNVRRDLHAAVDRINTRDAQTMKKGRAQASPLPRVSPNDLRRTFASWLKQNEIDSLTVARLLGHKSTRMVELVYGQLSDETFNRAIDAMPRVKIGLGLRSVA